MVTINTQDKKHSAFIRYPLLIISSIIIIFGASGLPISYPLGAIIILLGAGVAYLEKILSDKKMPKSWWIITLVCALLMFLLMFFFGSDDTEIEEIPTEQEIVQVEENNGAETIEEQQEEIAEMPVEETQIETSPVELPAITPKAEEADVGAAWVALKHYGKEMYPYGFDLHNIMGVIAEEQEAPNQYFLKATVTITNIYGAEYDTVVEADVVGTGKDVNNYEVTYFYVY